VSEVTLPPVSYRSLLRNRNFSALWLGQLVSVFGDRLHEIALLVLVGSLSGNDLSQIGVLIATIGLPSLLFGLFAGALADRWNRQRVMIIADLARVPLVIAIPILARSDMLWVYIITFLLTTVSLFFRPAKDGIIPTIVPEQGLLVANSLSSSTDTAMDVLGYPLAGALVGGLLSFATGSYGVDLAFYIDAGTYLFSALMIAQMRVPQQLVEQAEAGIGGMVRMVGEGLRFLRSNTVLLTNAALIAAAALLIGGVTTLSFGYATEVTDTGGFGYSVLEAAIGLGNIVGAFAVGRWGGYYRKGLLILLGIILDGIMHLGLFVVANLWIAAGLLALGGIANMLFFIPSITLTQEQTPNKLLGRVFSVRTTLITTAIICSNLVIGLGAEQYGVQAMFGVIGGLLVLIGLLAALLPSARNAK
jgi:MFS family permease